MAGKQQQQQHRSYRRLNGCSWPPHPFQVSAWVVLVYFTFIHFSTVSPQFVIAWQPASYLLVAILLVIHFVTHLLCTIIDPADDNVRRKNAKAKDKLPEFDRTKRKHVIENHECYICQVKVSHKSKHCSACNKCVYDFDHHCKWLNNCVGGRNYRIFIAMLASGVFGLLLIIVFSMVQFVAYFTDKYSGTILKPYRVSAVADVNSTATSTVFTTDVSANYTSTPTPASTVITATETIETQAVFRICSFPVPHIAWQVIVLLTVVLATISMCLLAHLLIFHLDLICKGMSTYDYISEQRNLEEKSEKGEAPSPPPIAKPYRANQVAPHTSKTLVAEVDANASARAYNENPYPNDKSVAQTSNGNANKGRYRQADADKPGDRGDADQSDSDDSVHDQQKRRMSADAVRSSRQHLQHEQEHPAALAIAVDEGERAQRHYDGDHNARGGAAQKRKFKQKRSSNTRRTDYDSATPTDVGLHSAHADGAGDGEAGMRGRGGTSDVGDKTTKTPGGTGWESDSGVGSDTLAVGLSSVRIRGHSADGSTRQLPQQQSSTDNNGSASNGAVVISATVEKQPAPSASHNSWNIPEAAAGVKAKKATANGHVGHGTIERKHSEQQVQVGHLALPVTSLDTDSDDEDKSDKNSDSSNVGMWSPQAFVPIRQVSASSTNQRKSRMENSDSDESLHEIPLSHVKTQQASDATYTKPSKPKHRTENGGRQHSESIQRYPADSFGRVNNGYSGIDDSDNSRSQAYETVPHVTTTNGGKSAKSKLSNGHHRSGKNGGEELGSGVRQQNDRRATSAGSARPPSAANSRHTLHAGATKSSGRDAAIQQYDAPSVDISSVTTSSEDRKLKEFLEKSLTDPHLGV